MAAVAQRSATDKFMRPLTWLGIPLFVITIAEAVSYVYLLLAVGSFFDDPWDHGPSDPDTVVPLAAYSASSLLFYALFGVITFCLFDRNNKHFARENALLEKVHELVTKARKAANPSEAKPTSLPHFQGMTAYASPRTPPREPLFWAVVIILQGVATVAIIIGPVLYLLDAGSMSMSMLLLLSVMGIALFVLAVLTVYMWYLLMKDMSHHDTAWAVAAARVRWDLGELGYHSGRIPIGQKLPDRPFWLYFVVSMFSGGLFVLYWWYALIKDGNDHFKNHQDFEDVLYRVVQDHPSWRTYRQA